MEKDTALDKLMEVLESLGQAVEEVAGRVKQAVIDLDPDRFGPMFGEDDAPGNAKKSAAKKSTAKKSTTEKKPAAKKPAAKKAPAKKPAAKKPAAKKTAGGPTKAELYDRAQELEIPGRSSMSKAQLQAAINKAEK